MKKIRVLFFILLYALDSLFCDGVCVTWDLHNTQLEITCKMQARYSTVSLVDNFGRRLISCSSPEVENSNKNCQRSSIDEIVAVNYLSTELMLTIQRNQVTDYDGQWTCQADSNETQTNVSSQIGSEDRYLVQLVVKPSNKTGNMMQVEVNCFSCRDPYGLLAEIIIDNKTVDSLTYDPSTSTCYHAKGMCRPDVCACFSNNQFIRQLTVDLLTPKLFSCMMSFVDIYTESKISKTAGIYFDGKDFIPVKTVTTIIKPGKSVAKTTTKMSLSSTEKSTNKILNEESMESDEALSASIISGLLIGFILLLILIGVIIHHCINFRKKDDAGKQNYIHLPKTERTFSLESDIEDEECAIKVPVETSSRHWLLAGFLCNVIHEKCYMHLKNKIHNSYMQLNNECNIDKQEHNNYLKSYKDRDLNYENVNGNFMRCAQNHLDYDYKIRDMETLARLLLPSRISCSEIFHDDDWTNFDHLLDLMRLFDADMSSRVNEACLKVRKFWNIWFTGDESFWTQEKLSVLTECLTLLEEYTGDFVNKDTTLQISKGVNILTDDNCMNLIGKWGQDLSLLVTKTSKSHVEYLHEQMFDLLKNNAFFKEYFMRKRSTENDLNKLTSLIMDIGLKVIQTFISLNVVNKDLDFTTFLENNKHDLFHAWHNKKRCCQCSDRFNESQKSSLTREQFSVLFCFVKDKEQTNHPQNNEYCICRFSPKHDALKAIDFSIALCIMLLCIKSKSTEIKSCSANPMIKGAKNLRNFRNILATTTEVTCEKYTMVWKDVESTLLEMSACVDSDFQNNIRKDIEKLETRKCSGDNVCISDMLHQCEQDIKLSLNQQHEQRFEIKLNDLKEYHTQRYTYPKQVTKWKANNGKIDLNIEFFPFVEIGHPHMYEVLIDINVPQQWNLDIMLETVRKEATSINEQCNLHIVETTFENFQLIVKVDVFIFKEISKFRNALERFIWILLQVCKVDFFCEASLSVIVTSLKGKPSNKEKIAKIILLSKMKLQTEYNPHFTSCAVWSNDEFVFVERNNSSLIFYNFKTDMQRFIRLPAMPFSMAVMEDNKIVMSFPEKQELRISIVEKETIKDIESTKMPGKCYTLSRKDPETVLVTIEGDGIYCYNLKNKKVSKVLIEIPNFVPHSDELFCKAGRIVHTCRANSSLYCYDADGDKLWILSDVLKHPTAITSDEFGNVFATDFVSSHLYLVTPDGKDYKILLSKNDGLFHPTFLYFCDELKRLLVVNRDNCFAFWFQFQYETM